MAATERLEITGTCKSCGYTTVAGMEQLHYDGCPESGGDYDQVPLSEERVRAIVAEELAKAGVKA